MLKFTNCIYVLSHLSAYICDNRHTVKIGSSQNLPARIKNYKTYYPTPIKVECYLYIHDYDCYQLDDDIKRDCNIYRKHCIDGGTEYYNISVAQLLQYIDNRGIVYDVYYDEDYKLYNLSEKQYYIDYIHDLMRQHRITTSCLESNKYKQAYNISMTSLLQLLTPIINLKQWQKDACEYIKLFLDDEHEKAGIIIAPTGCGKSYLIRFISIFCFILQSNNDVMIMNKRLQIFDQQFIDDFNDVICHFSLKIKIINMQNNDEFSNVDFINNTDHNHIYIINNDKFTASNRYNNYIDDNYSFGKIKLLILDECHWSGASEFNKFLQYMKENVVDKIIGFSATPVRTLQTNFNNTFLLFKSYDDNNINVIYNRTYIKSIIEKDRLPSKFIFIPIIQSSISNEIDQENNLYSLNESGYKSFVDWLNVFINVSIYKKGILWFSSIKSLEKFYDYIISNKHIFNNIINIEFIKSHSQNDPNNENIKKFKNNHNNMILLVVDRGTEGFDDKYVDFGCDMYICQKSDPLKKLQKEGRVSRLCEGKEIGYYGTLIIKHDINMKNNIAKQFADWIKYVLNNMSTDRLNIKFNCTNDNESDNDEIKINLIDQLIDNANIINLDYYEIRNEIIRELNDDNTFNVNSIKKQMRMINKLRFKNNMILIDTKKLYDEYANIHNMPTNIVVDDNNWTKFLRFDFDEFILKYYTKEELKQVCKVNNIRNFDMYNDYCKQDNKCFNMEYIISNVYGCLFNLDDYFPRKMKNILNFYSQFLK